MTDRLDMANMRQVSLLIAVRLLVE